MVIHTFTKETDVVSMNRYTEILVIDREEGPYPESTTAMTFFFTTSSAVVLYARNLF